MVILSVDYGDVRTGIAVCDKFGMLASPVKVIVERDSGALADEITEIATEKNSVGASEKYGRFRGLSCRGLSATGRAYFRKD